MPVSSSSNVPYQAMKAMCESETTALPEQKAQRLTGSLVTVRSSPKELSLLEKTTSKQLNDTLSKNGDFVKNFDFVRNTTIDLASNEFPVLCAKKNGGEEMVYLYYDEKNFPQARNGAVYNALIASDIEEKNTKECIPAGNALIKDGALSFGLNRFRDSTGKDTQTQQIIANLNKIEDPNDRNVELLKLVNGDYTCSTDRLMKIKMVNDPVRRAFESYYAKHALEKNFSSLENYEKFSRISNEQVKYIKDNYVSADLFMKYQLAWENKAFDTRIVGLDQLQGFYTRAEQTLSTLAISPEAKVALFDIYKHRYLSYALKNEAEVAIKLADGHWDGIFEPIQSAGKGRIELNIKEGNLFRQADSHHIGIMRNIDPTPVDLRLNDPYHIQYETNYNNNALAGASTRCPDRLEMQDPDHANALKQGSYMKDFFEKGMGTYVNGPSGSILIEHGAIRACKDIHANTSSEEIEAYLEIQALLFIYVDGGHSMDEISYALANSNVHDKFYKAFGEKEGFDKVGSKLFMDVESLNKAAKDTAIFNDALKGKDSVHHELAYSSPAGLSGLKSKTNDLALRQSIDGRGVLYRPGKVLLNELKEAAKVLYQVIQNLSSDGQAEIGAHILGEGRLLAGKTSADLLAVLQRISTTDALQNEESGATDRAVLIALMGDIGGFYTTPANASAAMMSELNTLFAQLGLSVPVASAIQNMRNKGGSGAVGPDKRAERKIKSYSSRADIPFRAGVHDKGEEADRILNIAPENRIPANRWVVFNIST